MYEATLIALMVFVMCAVIAFLVAVMIKSIFWCIKYNENMRAKNNASYGGASLTTKAVGH